MEELAPDKSEIELAFEAYEQTWEHIDLVVRLLASAQVQLMRRAVTHDRTKVKSPERKMFAKVTHRLKGLTYGSPEYKQCLQEMLGEALGHHYSHNRHHPEFFEPPEVPQEDILDIEDAKNTISFLKSLGSTEYHSKNLDFLEKLCDSTLESKSSSVNNMNLFDLLEMFIDWIAATKRHADGSIYKSIEINQARFGLSEQLVSILKKTVPWIEDEFIHLKNQHDIAYELGNRSTHVDGVSLDHLT